MTGKVTFSGFAQLEKELDKLKVSTGKAVLRRTLKKAALPMAELANSFAPVGATGEYAQSYHYSTKLTKRQAALQRREGKATVQGFVGTDDPAGVQQEFGNINHGPQPALRPAWDQDRKALLGRLRAQLWQEIEKSIARAERKAARR